MAVTGDAAMCSIEVGNSVTIPRMSGLDCVWEGFQGTDFTAGSIGCLASVRVGCSGTSTSGFYSQWTGGASGALDTPTLMSVTCSPFSVTFRYHIVPADVACCAGMNVATTFDITWTA